MRQISIGGRLLRGAVWSVVLLGVFCFAGLGHSLGTPENLFLSDVKTVVDNDTNEVVVEGIVQGGTIDFFCCVGYPFALDASCLMPTIIFGDQDIDLRDYVGLRVQVTGTVIQCPPRALCPCRIAEDADLKSVKDVDLCVSVETIDEIEACSTPAN